MRRLLLTLVSVCIASHLSLAQQDMSFSAARSAMLKNNSAVRGERHLLDAAYDNMRATRGMYLPTINIIGGFTLLQRDISIDLGGTKGIVTNSLQSLIDNGVNSGILSNDLASLLSQGLAPIIGADWRYTLQKRTVGYIGTTITMPIYAGGRINIANRIAKQQLDMARYSLDATESHLITELVERYYGVILARKMIEVCQMFVNAVSQHLADAKAMEEEGLVAHSVVVYLQYRLSEAEVKLRDAESKSRVAEYALSTIVGEDIMINPTDRIFLSNNIQDIDYYREAALNLNHILQEAEAEQNIANEGVKLARAALLPEMVAMGGAVLYGYQLSDILPRWTVGVGVNFTIFDGLSKERRLKAAKSTAMGISEVVDNARDNILLLIDKEYFTLENSLQDIATSARAIEFAESYYNSAIVGFNEGLTSGSDLMDACTELAASRVEYLNAAYNSCVALARLLEASGLSSTLDLYRVNCSNIDIE